MTIPKIAFSFWEGDQFTHLHYLTFQTFAKYNPDFTIIIYTSTKSNCDLVKWSSGEQSRQLTNIYDIHNLKKIPNLELKHIDVEGEINYNKPLSSVWKSDIIRIMKLYEHGGFYIDFDTLFIGKIPESLFTFSQDLGVNTYENVINNAFLVARPKSPLVHIILQNILEILHSDSVKQTYQQFGPELITRLCINTHLQQNLYFIPNVMTCPYIWNEMDKLFQSNIRQDTDETFCLHWYNGGAIPREYCSKFMIDAIDKDRNRFEYLLSNALL
jgi:hypothetical protein